MPSEMRFSELRKRLQAAGYTLARVHGSHHYFTKPGQTPVSIPVHQGKVKPYYVRQVERISKGD